MTNTTRSTDITLLTGSLGPQNGEVVSVPLVGDAMLPPLLIEDPSPHFPGVWRRLPGTSGDHTYVRVPRIAAP